MWVWGAHLPLNNKTKKAVFPMMPYFVYDMKNIHNPKSILEHATHTHTLRNVAFTSTTTNMHDTAFCCCCSLKQAYKSIVISDIFHTLHNFWFSRFLRSRCIIFRTRGDSHDLYD